jgi:hypothetical protein
MIFVQLLSSQCSDLCARTAVSSFSHCCCPALVVASPPIMSAPAGSGDHLVLRGELKGHNGWVSEIHTTRKFACRWLHARTKLKGPSTASHFCLLTFRGLYLSTNRSRPSPPPSPSPTCCSLLRAVRHITRHAKYYTHCIARHSSQNTEIAPSQYGVALHLQLSFFSVRAFR